MITQINENENLNCKFNISFIATVKELKISTLLDRCGIRKKTRIQRSEKSCDKCSVFEIFQFLLLMIFQGSTLHRFLGPKKQDLACSKNTYQRFMSNIHYNWQMISPYLIPM